MHWKNLANYDYLGSYSLEGKAKEVTLTIKNISQKKVKATGGVEDDCIVADFAETEVDGVTVKPMVLNKTNCKIIEKVYNSGDIEDWIGKPITIFATSVRFQRDMVPCLRVKAEKPVAKEYKCSICGSTMKPEHYNSTIKNYGVSICSRECLEKYQANKENKEN